METPTQRPIHEIRRGHIKAVIWANTNSSGTWYSTNIVRIYKDGDQWKQSNAFGSNDLLLVSKVTDLAFDWIHEREKPEPGEQ